MDDVKELQNRKCKNPDCEDGWVRHEKCCGTGELSAGAHTNECFECNGKGKIRCPDCSQSL